MIVCVCVCVCVENKHTHTHTPNTPLRVHGQVTWTGQMLGDLMEVFVHCGCYHTAQEVLGEATTTPHAILGYLPAQALNTLLAAALEKQDADTAVVSTVVNGV